MKNLRNLLIGVFVAGALAGTISYFQVNQRNLKEDLKIATQDYESLLDDSAFRLTSERKYFEEERRVLLNSEQNLLKKCDDIEQRYRESQRELGNAYTENNNLRSVNNGLRNRLIE